MDGDDRGDPTVTWLSGVSYTCVPVTGINSRANLFQPVHIQKHDEENLGEPAVLVNLYNTTRRPGVPTAVGGFTVPRTAA